jgi:hypothetical protein
MKRYLVLTITLLFTLVLNAQEQQIVVPYTLADRDRTIRAEAKMEAIEAKMDALETKMDALETKMDVKFDSIQRQIDQLSSMFYWGFGILITLFIFMLGYMIWDRRTAMQPALAQSLKAEENSQNLIKTLREYSKKHPDLAEILRIHGIL